MFNNHRRFFSFIATASACSTVGLTAFFTAGDNPLWRLRQCHMDALERDNDRKTKDIAPIPSLLEQPGMLLWGDNSHALVDPTSQHQKTIKVPRRLAAFNGKFLSSASFAYSHAAAVDNQGNVYQWGSGVDVNPHEPSVTLSGKNIKQVACDSSNVYALSKNGKVYRMNANKAIETEERNLRKNNAYLPFLSDGLETITSSIGKVEEIQSGAHHVAMRTANGQVYVYKSNLRDAIPEKLTLDEKVTQIASGRNHVICLTENGRVYGWGGNNAGQLGIGEVGSAPSEIDTPVEVKSIWSIPGSSDIPQTLTSGSASNDKICHVAAGGDSSFFVKSSSNGEGYDVLSCGYGLNGQLGCGNFVHMAGNAVRVKMLSFISQYDDEKKKQVPVSIKDIICGNRHVVALLDTARQENNTSYGTDAFAWGSNVANECFVNSKSKSITSPSLMQYSSSMISMENIETSGNLKEGLNRLQIPVKFVKQQQQQSLMNIALGDGITAVYSMSN